MSIPKKNKLNFLLQETKAGGVFFSSYLKGKGYSAQLIKKYRDSGWFTAIAPGVIHRTNDKISPYGLLSAYNQQMDKHLHIAAHSALEAAGFFHYVPVGKPRLMVYHRKKETIPAWMKKLMLSHELTFFTSSSFNKHELYTKEINGFEVTLSSPEHAFLECLSLAPLQYSFMDLYYLMEQLTSLRADKLQVLLEQTKSVKVKRTFLYMAEKAGHFWFRQLDLSKLDLGTGKNQLIENGVYHSKYKITLPKELIDYE